MRYLKMNLAVLATIVAAASAFSIKPEKRTLKRGAPDVSIYANAQHLTSITSACQLAEQGVLVATKSTAFTNDELNALANGPDGVCPAPNNIICFGEIQTIDGVPDPVHCNETLIAVRNGTYEAP